MTTTASTTASTTAAGGATQGTRLPDDPALPAVVHLVGPDAEPILAAVVESAGGRLLDARANHVQYRPGSDAVVRFEASVAWGDQPPQRETLLAATTRDGVHPGTVVVTAAVDGVDLAIGVWRWPFDPVLTDLTTMVTPALAADALGDLVTGALDLRVVAYRPTERAVVRVVDSTGVVLYVKVLPPAQVAPLVERHTALIDAGLPVPEVVASGDGWLAMTELAGTTLRDLIKGAPGTWPTADAFAGLLTTLRDVALPARAAASRVDDAFGHAAMLRLVAPEIAPMLDRVTTALDPARERSAARRATVHGDMHEAQVIVDGGQVIGLLDIDDVGVGDPLDDMATLIAHTLFRAIVADDDALARRLTGYVDELFESFAAETERRGHDRRELQLVVAAVLLGLATGPYRVQRAGWRDELSAVVAQAEALATDERSLRTASSRSHDRPR